MLPADNRAAALRQEALFQDERLSQYWDGERALGRLISATLKLAIPVAWDVYLLYHPGAAWGDAGMHGPDFWMHQLDERFDLLLDPGRLRAEVQDALARNCA